MAGTRRGLSGVSGTPSQGIAQACRGATFGQRAQAGSISLICPQRKKLRGAKRLLPCLNINPRR